MIDNGFVVSVEAFHLTKFEPALLRITLYWLNKQLPSILFPIYSWDKWSLFTDMGYRQRSFRSLPIIQHCLLPKFCFYPFCVQNKYQRISTLINTPSKLKSNNLRIINIFKRILNTLGILFHDSIVFNFYYRTNTLNFVVVLTCFFH